MRLLHSTTLELREFLDHEDIPYAILSHTWAEEEVSFQEMEGFNAITVPDVIKQKLGFKKIEACCAQAREDGFDYVWIDTCCIDKRSSAELSEAINSMYRWYQDCTVCYAYLADVYNNAIPALQEQMFRKSKWFTRGWTLQELIGPPHLEFYGDQWHTISQDASLGTKTSLQNKISQITKIPEEVFLNNYHPASGYCIAQKMSWAANRSTTRVEDRAYCLLGLFNVNMPLLYGEGSRAFLRLQEEIMKVSTDESLFAWTSQEIATSFLAVSPDCFANSGRVAQRILHRRRTPSTVTNKGLRLEATLLAASSISASTFTRKYAFQDGENTYAAVLNCYDTNSGDWIAILIAHPGDRTENVEFTRVDAKKLELIDPLKHDLKDNNRTIIYVRISEIYGTEASYMDKRIRHFVLEQQHKTLVVKKIPFGFRLVRRTPKELWTNSGDEIPWMAKLVRQAGKGDTSYVLSFHDRIDGFTVIFTLYPGTFLVQVLPDDAPNLGNCSKSSRPLLEASCDRATCSMTSQRIVSASVRPERWRGEPCYALRISVSTVS